MGSATMISSAASVTPTLEIGMNLILNTKLCGKCKQTKEPTDFTKDHNRKDGLDPWCKICKRASVRASYRKNKEKYNKRSKEWWALNREEFSKKKREKRDQDPRQDLVYAAKHRAKTKGFDFDISKDDIVIPDICPILGTEISRRNTKQSRSSPSIDRIDSTKGYTKDNIQVISWQANTMKSNASKEELLAFAKWVLDFYKEED